MRPKEPRVGDKCGRRVGDKGETSVNSCGPMHAKWETSQGIRVGEVWETGVGDKWETRGRQV